MQYVEIFQILRNLAYHIEETMSRGLQEGPKNPKRRRKKQDVYAYLTRTKGKPKES